MSASRTQPYALAAYALASVGAWVAVDDPWLRQTIDLVHLHALIVLSLDVFARPTRETPSGHALHVGLAAYAVAWLQTRHGWAAGPAAGAALGLGAVVGVATGALLARLQGAGFALATMALQLGFFQCVYLFPEVLGGEEGFSGLTPLVAPGRATQALLAGSVCLAWACQIGLEASRFGRDLRAVGDDPRLAESSGLPVQRYRLALFAASSVWAAWAGVLYTTTLHQVGAEVASSRLSIQALLLALVGGSPGGAVLAAGLLVAAREGMAGAVPGDRVIAAVGLVAAALVVTGTRADRGAA